MYMQRRMPMGDFKTGTLTDGNALKIDMRGAPMPATVTLNSAAAGRRIRLGTGESNGEFYTPTIDVTSPTMLVVVVSAAITWLEITGAANDVWRVR